MSIKKMKGISSKIRKSSADHASEENGEPASASAAAPVRASALAASGGATKRDRQWWFDARGLSGDESDILDAAYQSNCFAILIDPDQARHVMTGKQLIVSVENARQLDSVPDDA